MSSKRRSGSTRKLKLEKQTVKDLSAKRSGRQAKGGVSIPGTSHPSVRPDVCTVPPGPAGAVTISQQARC